MNNVVIKNISSSTVVIVAPDARFRRDLVPGRAVSVNRDIYEELMFEPGMQNLMRCGFLEITGDNVEEATVVIEESGFKSLSEAELAKIFDEKDITAFAKIIPNASPATKDTIVKLAVEKNIADRAFVALIDKYCNIDLIDAISKQHQVEK